MSETATQSIVLGMFLALCVLGALPLYTIGKKLGYANCWFAFVPILNIFFMADIAGKDWWWALLMFVPGINIAATVILWMGIAEAVDKPSWLGLLMLVPGINLLLPFYLAFG